MKPNRKLLALIAVAAMIAIAGCGAETTENQQKEIADAAGQNVSDVRIGASYYYEVKVTEKNQMGLVKAQPPFIMEHSLERANLIKRYKYLNDANNVHHVYLIDEGQVVGYYVAQGKVSSVNSKLTNDKQIVRVEGCEWHDGSEGACYKVVESPQMDGSYGTNGEAIFFFTTDGDYVQTSLDYVVSEEPKAIHDEVLLTDDVDEEENTNNSSSTGS